MGSDLKGRTLGHFHVAEKIGEGGMGVVYVAMDQRLRRTVALKVLRPEVADDPRRKGRFLREARFAASLAHPNVCAVHEVGESDGLVYMAMEMLEGSSLRVRLARTRLPVSQVLTIARDVARALARAHEKGIVHRDLKPDNVIVYEPNPGVLVAKVLDFGLAKALEGEQRSPEDENTATFVTAHGVAIGTPGYMAPEQAKGLEVDARADIYSFGVMLYEMLTGRSPYKGRSPEELIAASGREEMRPPSEVVRGLPSAIDAFYMRCVDRTINRRFPDGSALVAALQPLLDGGVKPFASLSFDDATDRLNPISSGKPAASTMSVPLGIDTQSLADLHEHEDDHEEEDTDRRPPVPVPSQTLEVSDHQLIEVRRIADVAQLPIEEQKRRTGPPVAISQSGSIPPPPARGLRAVHFFGFVAMGLLAFFVARMAVTTTPHASATPATPSTAATMATTTNTASIAAAVPAPMNAPADEVATEPAVAPAKTIASPAAKTTKAHRPSSRPTAQPAAPAVTTVSASPPPPAPATQAQDDCSNPFYVSSEGIRVPKRHCLR